MNEAVDLAFKEIRRMKINNRDENKMKIYNPTHSEWDVMLSMVFLCVQMFCHSISKVSYFFC